MSSKPADSPYIAWIDLETTGNRADDSIIEVGFVLTDRDLNEVISRSLVVKPLTWHLLRRRMTDVVWQMHDKNGLLNDLAMGTGFEVGEADKEIAAILKVYGKGNHIPFAGSGVAHFDRQYIKREMPKTNDLLSYWAYDIGSMRRFLQWWGVETPGSDLSLAKTHRALDDIREHINETRIIRDRLASNADKAWRYDDLD